MAVLDLTLTPEQVTRLDGASRVEMVFPHDFYPKDVVRGLVYGDA